MEVKQGRHFARRGAWAVACVSAVYMAGTVANAQSQTRNPSSQKNPYYGSVTVRTISEEPLKLSLDDAIRRGLQNNLGLREAESGEKQFQGEKDQALQQFLPTINASGGTGVYQHNLVALGFGPSALSNFATLFPGGVLPPGFSTITKNDLTQGQVSYDQTLFSGVVISGWKAAGAAARAAYFAKMSARGEVVQQVATAYLRVIADASEVDNATALQKQDELAFEDARQAHQAGTL